MTTLASTPIAAALASIYGLLSAASIIVYIKGLIARAGDHRELVDRMQSWWTIVTVLAGAFLAGPTATLVLFAVIGFMALREYLTLLPTRREDRPLQFAAYAAVPVCFYLLYRGETLVASAALPILLLLASALTGFSKGRTDGYIDAAGRVFWGVMLIAFGFGHTAYLLSLEPAATGIGLLLLLILLSQLNDVAQYVTGRSFGGRKILPRVSPNKTWSGFLSGVAVTALAGAIAAPALTPLTTTGGLIVGGLIAVAGFCGDATISAAKRDLKVKDCGRLLPGHGGVLDRIDGLIFAAPVFCHFVMIARQGGWSVFQ